MCYMWNHNESNRLNSHFFIRISESVKDNPGYRGWGKQRKRLMSFAWFYLTKYWNPRIIYMGCRIRISEQNWVFVQIAERNLL